MRFPKCGLSKQLVDLGHVKGKNLARHDKMDSPPTPPTDLMRFARVSLNIARRGLCKCASPAVMTSSREIGDSLKENSQPLQYAEKISAARSGMARAAEKAGRDGPS